MRCSLGKDLARPQGALPRVPASELSCSRLKDQNLLGRHAFEPGSSLQLPYILKELTAGASC